MRDRGTGIQPSTSSATSSSSTHAPLDPAAVGHVAAFALYEQLSDAIVACTPDGRIVQVNRAAEKLAALPRAQLVGRNVRDVSAFAVGSSPVGERLARALADGVELQLEEMSAVTGGPVLLHLFPAPWGATLLVRPGQASDTARLQEERLVRSERRCRAVVDASADVVFWLDAEGRALEPCPSWERYTGQSFAAHAGLGWLQAVHPDDVEQALAVRQEALSTGAPVRGELRLRRADGAFRRCLLRSHPVHDERTGQLVEWVGAFTDVESARQSLEAQESLALQIERERRRLAEVLDQLPVGVAIAGADGQLVQYNRLAPDLIGRPQAVTVGRAIRTMSGYAPDGRYLPPEAWPLARALAGGSAISPERIHLHGADGDRRTLAVAAAPLRDADGRLLGAVATAQDVTAFARAEEQLKASEAKWRLLAESIPHFVWSADLRGVLDYCNDQFLAYSGLSLEELRAGGWSRMIHPDDLPAARAAWLRAAAGDGAFEILQRHRRASDGAWRWFVCRARRLPGADGHPVWFGTCTDVDESKRAQEALAASEARLRRIVASNIVGVCRWGPDGQLREANEALKRLVGVDPAAELPQWDRLLPDGWWQTHQDAVRPLLGPSGTTRPFELELVRADGARVPVLVLTVPDDERPGEGLALVVDLSERQRAEQLQAQLLDVVGHDLRSPLGALIVSAELLLKSALSGDQRRGVERIHRSALRMNRLVRDLVDATQVRVGRPLAMLAAPCDVERLCQHAAGEVGVCEPGRDFRVFGEGDPRVSWDAERIEQALANLLTNAVRHGASDAPIEVRWTAGEERVRIEVRNAGEPVDAQLLPLLFEPFRRGPAHARTKGASVGLGLFIVRQIAAAHGGEAGLESSAEAGTVAWIELPRSAPLTGR